MKKTIVFIIVSSLLAFNLSCSSSKSAVDKRKAKKQKIKEKRGATTCPTKTC
ncbi:MAG: hypothetical protein U0V72_04425 [Cytophagales bacterium]